MCKKDSPCRNLNGNLIILLCVCFSSCHSLEHLRDLNLNFGMSLLQEGIPISKFMELKDDVSEKVKTLKLRLSDMGTRLILKMIFFDNFIHGDLHPGMQKTSLNFSQFADFSFSCNDICFSLLRDITYQVICWFILLRKENLA